MRGTRRIHPLALMAVAPVLIAVTLAVSILYGAKNIDASTIVEAVFHFDPSDIDHQIVTQSRMPRAVGALLIGAFLAVSGAIMQGMTRNYLASPSIMGVSDGSVVAVTLCLILLPATSKLGLILCSLAGSALGALLVFGLAWLLPNGTSPVRMAILGTIVGTFLGGAAEAAAMYFQVSQSVSFWYNARLNQMDPALIKLVIPFAAAGLILALGLSKSITLLSMGDEIAAGLGQRTMLVKGLSMLCVVILTGVSVALAGKIAFVGLLVPHIVRFLVGVDYRFVIPCSALLGGLFLAWCDIGSRFVNAPFETPIGVVTSMIGVPFFLYLIKRKGGRTHAV
ncbi:iron ABC transporter permease [Saccharibacillus sp. CPCC 101409]|uniref:FecCD family ABC transporter permease n=1 Tax=Saccharibacillus sp. CPCC 101409 TaxID=3058041 RepID=UPI002670E1A0|nr:iron ABC transporter permease [Saccharibacillus sp. CPCC 101409]MDO3411998.1 iron ABC transporter permease [Saccharibacillus sp. CPCC 101409]